MPEYLAPAVYLEEVDTGAKPIEGVSTSTAGMVGVTERGPVGVPILITSFASFHRWFGDLLEEGDYTSATGQHCHLPHAVEGFFTNGGKRVFVTRIEQVGATPAEAVLFDRGTPGGLHTMLLRSAARGTGTIVNVPFVLALDDTGTNVNDWLRVGDGSGAEYRQVVSTAATTHVPLSFALDRAHDSGVTIDDFVRATAGAGFTLAAAADAGDDEIVLTGIGHGLGGGELLEVGTAPHAEHRFVGSSVEGAADTTVVLDAELHMGHANGAAAIEIDISGASAGSTNLLADARSGDPVVSGETLGADFDDPTHLLVIAAAGTPEVRRIGALKRLELAQRTVEELRRGATVQQVQTPDDERQVQGGSTNTVLVLDDVDGIEPGQRLVVDPGGTADDVTVQAVDPAGPSVTLTAALGAAPAAGTVVALRPKATTAEAVEGATTLALDDRLGLEQDDVLAIGAGVELEYARVSGFVGDPAAAPDAGAIVLAAPLASDHAAGTAVRRVVVTPVSPSHPVPLALPAASGSRDLFVSDDDGFSTGDVVLVRTAQGGEHVVELSDADDPQPISVELDTPLERNHEAGAPLVERRPLIRAEVIDTGGWGNRLRIAVENEPRGLVSTDLEDIPAAAEIVLSSPTGAEPGTVLELSDPDTGAVVGGELKVVTVDRRTGRVRLAGPLAAAQTTAHANAVAAGTRLPVRSREVRLTVLLMRRPDPTAPSRNDTVIESERFDNLSMDPRHSRYLVSVLGAFDGPPATEDRRPQGDSWYVRLEDLEASAAAREGIRLGPEALVDVLPSGRARPARRALSGGDDAIALMTDADYIGQDAVDPEDRTGLRSLGNIEEISIVAIPGRTSPAIQSAVISHCEELRYRFAVLDALPSPGDSIADVRAQRQQYDTRYAALYHPWLLVPRAYPGGPAIPPTQAIPPSGHVAGIYARTDIDRGVHKAPANEVVRGALGLTRVITRGEHDLLNPFPVNVNVIRDFRPNNRGIRVWGGRVVTSDSDWKYVNVRRLLIFIEASLERGLQWVVFEPNDEPLWARVRRAVSNFLTVVWRNGALEGTREEAFFVKCDRTTMSQTQIDNGQLICLVGVAPVKPAEFVIVRIGLWTAHAED